MKLYVCILINVIILTLVMFIQPGKFFKEAPWRPHLDVRFTLSYGHPQSQYFYDMLGIVPILAGLTDSPAANGPMLNFGGLIGWTFNKKMLPWDDDLDMTVSMDMLDEMWKKFGTHTEVELPNGTTVWVEVNPHYRETDNKLNTIDARVIHKDLGIFIDIAGVEDNKGKGKRDIFSSTSLWPSQQVTFGPDNDIIYVPNDPVQALKDRYGTVHVLKTAGTPIKPELWELGDDRYWLI